MIVVYFETGGIGSIPPKRRYLRWPGERLFKGMYRNRRPAGYRYAVWTDDINEAFRFRSPSDAKRRKACIVPGTWDRIKFEKV